MPEAGIFLCLYLCDTFHYISRSYFLFAFATAVCIRAKLFATRKKLCVKCHKMISLLFSNGLNVSKLIQRYDAKLCILLTVIDCRCLVQIFCLNKPNG